MSVGVPSLRPASEGLRVSSAFASIPGFEIPCFECEVSKRCATGKNPMGKRRRKKSTQLKHKVDTTAPTRRLKAREVDEK